MVRRIFSGIVIGFSSILLLLSVVGIIAAWIYNEPLTTETLARMDQIDETLTQAQSALQTAQGELGRALKIVDSSEEAFENFSEQIAVARGFLDTVTEVLDETIKPNLETSREKIDQAQGTLDELRASIATLNRIPFVRLDTPDEDILDSFVEIMDSLESEVSRVEEVADQASSFLNDTSALTGGDFEETRSNIQELQTVVAEYESKVDTWRGQLVTLEAESPGWIDRASLILTIFLLWFGFSQFGLLLHGLTLWRGANPLVVLRREPIPLLDSPAAPRVVTKLDEAVDEMRETADELDDELEAIAEELDDEDPPGRPE